MAAFLSRFLLAPETDPLWALAEVLVWWGPLAIALIYALCWGVRFGRDDSRWIRRWMRSWLPPTPDPDFAEDVHGYDARHFAAPAPDPVDVERRRRLNAAVVDLQTWRTK